jgi:proline iminopeptidase
LLTSLFATDALARQVPPAGYYDAKAPDAWSGGVKMVDIDTPSGKFRVWTKRVGSNPKLKVLLLHGGPGATHDYFEPFDSYFPAQGIEYIYYDQLGSGRSDKPTDTKLWTIDRFVDEVEQVRKALDLGPENFCVLGHSWGGVLAIEYALKYQANLKCVVISNMMASIPAYNDYANTVLMPEMDQAQLAKVKALEAAGKTADPDYMGTLIPMHYEKHILRRPADQWPEPVTHAFRPDERRALHPDPGPQRTGRQRPAAELGPVRRPQEDRRPDPGDRGQVRHDGPGLYGEDVQGAAQGPVSVPGQRQPHGDVRRPGELLRRADRVPEVN